MWKRESAVGCIKGSLADDKQVKHHLVGNNCPNKIVSLSLSLLLTLAASVARRQRGSIA